MKQNKLFVFGIICVTSLCLSVCASRPDTQENHIQKVVAITEVFGDGQKVTAVAVEYDTIIKNQSLSSSSFSVGDRTISTVYTNASAAKSQQSVAGNYVIIELSPDDKDAETVISIAKVRQGRGKQAPGASPAGANLAPPPPTEQERKVDINVLQTASIITEQGLTYLPFTEPISNSVEINVIADDFQYFEYADPETGVTLRYNLYIPKNYDRNKSYPLVLFMHDAGATSDIYNNIGLIQGNGGTVWAMPEEQAKHESFVVVPQYPLNPSLAEDDFTVSPYLDATVNTIGYLESQYSIDAKRIYATGQSGGCMAACEMNIRYPDLFAASLLIAGQWNPETMKAVINKNLWVVVYEGDPKASSGMNAVMESLEEAGARISRSFWGENLSSEEYSRLAAEVLQDENNIKYTMLSGGDHMATWMIAYNIEGLRDWLFTQTL